jgi:hypothetical protein
VDVFGTYNVQALSNSSSLIATLNLLVNNATGLASSSQITSCGVALILEIKVPDHRILEDVAHAVEKHYKPKIQEAICTKLDELGGTDLTAVLSSLNGALLPFLSNSSEPPIVIPNYDPALLLNFTSNPLIGLVDFVLDDLIGSDGPFGFNRIVASLTNNTGMVHLDFGQNGTDLTTQEISSLGNVTLGVYNVSIGGLTSFKQLELLVPRRSFSLDSQLSLAEFELNVSFFVNTVVGGVAFQDNSELFETGRLILKTSDLTVGFAVFVEIDGQTAARFNLDQIMSVGCLKAAFLGGNVTQARLNFALRKLVIETMSNTSKLEGSVDALINSLMLLFVTSYNKVIPAFINAIVISPAIDAANLALAEKILAHPAPCLMRQSSSTSSAFPFNPLSSSIVLGAVVGIWLIVVGLVSQHQWTLYKIRKEAIVDEKYPLLEDSKVMLFFIFRFV